mgnify:CR=1 FL=1
MEELTLEKFEEASEIVKEVTLETKLIYSEYFSAQTGKYFRTHRKIFPHGRFFRLYSLNPRGLLK